MYLMEFVVSLFKLFCRIVGFFKGRKYRYPQIFEDNFTYMNLEEKIWYGYKYLVRQIEVGEYGKHTEEYFAEQNLDFSAEGFVETAAVTLCAAGDLLTTGLLTPENTKHLWGDVEAFYAEADLRFANLETPLVPGRPAGFLGSIFTTANLNNTPEMFAHIVNGGNGPNFLSTGNNHALDQGEDGLLATIDFLDSQSCGHAGTAKSAQARDDFPLLEINGVKIAMLAYTYAVNGKEPPEEKSFLVNYIRLNREGTDLSLIREHVRLARERGADIVVASLHWGMEYESFPLQIGIDMGHRIMEECGVDFILGNHAHTIQPAERYRFTDPFSGEEKEGLILYALGDLMPCLSYDMNSLLGNLAKVRISKGRLGGREVTRITNLQMMPFFAYAQNNTGKSVADFRLLDLVNLNREVLSGTCRYPFTKKDIKQIKRLARLLYKVFPQLNTNTALYGGRSEKDVPAESRCEPFPALYQIVSLRNIIEI